MQIKEVQNTTKFNGLCFSYRDYIVFIYLMEKEISSLVKILLGPETHMF